MKYNFTKQEITDLKSVNQKKVTHYVYFVENYKIDFLYKPSKKPQGLIVMFHGAKMPEHLCQFSEGSETHIKIAVFCRLVIHC